MQLKNFTKSALTKLRQYSVPEFFTTLIIGGALCLVAFNTYQINREIPYIKTLDIIDPIKIDKDNYNIGEDVVGFVEGERYIGKAVIFNRTLICKEYREHLKPLRIENPPVGRIDRKTTLFRLEDELLLIPHVELKPAVDCEVIFAPQTVVDKYILGGEKLQNDQSFRTTKFNINHPETETRPTPVDVPSTDGTNNQKENPLTQGKPEQPFVKTPANNRPHSCTIKILGLCLLP